ncbi:MAG: type II methionyl aminopeptidase [Thaumarchaeota archaeon]|nr:type II methionyl aminopeptidase [Nitrososphaerota archaeon]
MQVQDYINAGKIASEVRENARKKYHVGSTLFEICESIEKEIGQKGGKCAFPVNASLNEIAAHYTAEPNDSIVVKETDLLKIDLGVQINGYIADTAVTVCYDPNYDYLVQAAEAALKDAMSIMRAGTKSSDVGKAIEGTVKQMGGIPIANLSGHSLEQYTIHAGKSVPNIWSIGSFSFQSTEAYACEPFVTTRDGLGFVREGRTRNIFSLATRKRSKDEDANRMIDFIWQKFNMLPFALRWIVNEWDEKTAKLLLDKLVQNKIVKSYPILVEANNQRVAQAEHTFIPQENGVTVTTI